MILNFEIHDAASWLTRLLYKSFNRNCFISTKSNMFLYVHALVNKNQFLKATKHYSDVSSSALIMRDRSKFKRSQNRVPKAFLNVSPADSFI